MEIKDNDFVKVEFDIYANDKLVQTTNEKKGKEAQLQDKVFNPQTIIIGKAFILKALDEEIKKKQEGKIELTPEKAYGKRQKDLIKTFNKSVFEKQKLKVVPGVTYDFNGMYGTVRSVVGGRVMVDFNNPLSGKNIKINYKVLEKVEDMKEKIKTIMTSILRVPENMYEVTIKEKIIEMKIPQQLIPMKDNLKKSFEEISPDIKNYEIKFAYLKK